MRNFVDLHTHSSASDGTFAPAEVIALAERRRLAAVAVTDHDTIDGLAEAAQAARQFPDLRLIPGIEISALFTGGTLHILGLGIDPAAPALAELTARLRAAREDRNPRILEILAGMGRPVTMDEVLAQVRRLPAQSSRRVVGRVHIAQAMVRRGYVKDLAQAFDQYLGDDAPAYVDKERMAPQEAIAAIVRSGGAAVLAHPPQLNCQNVAQLERIVRDLMRHGLGGIEAYHSDNTPQQTRMYLDLALKHKLGICGGSDFHGGSKSAVHLGTPRVPRSVICGAFEKILFK